LVKNTLEYYEGESNAILKQDMKDEAFNRWMVYLLIRNSDQAKYVSLSNGLVSQFLMQNNPVLQIPFVRGLNDEKGPMRRVETARRGFKAA
jgi:hypothetical protein